MPVTENEFIGKLLDVLDVCSELKGMIPDEWPPEAQEQARKKIDLVMNMLRIPHRGLSILEGSAGDGSILTLHMDKATPEPKPGGVGR